MLGDALKKVGGLFVEIESKPAAPKVEQENNISTVPGFNVPGSQPPSRPVGMDVARSQEQDEKSRQHFQKLLEDRNLPGPDYLEFHRVLEQYASLPLDEPTKYKTAAAPLLVMGVTKPKLIESAGHYLNVLENDRKNFLIGVSEKQNNDVAGRDAEIANLKSEIQKNELAMQELAKKNSDAVSRMQVLEQEKAKAEENIRAKQQSYLVHSDAMVAKINSEIQKIQNYL